MGQNVFSKYSKTIKHLGTNQKSDHTSYCKNDKQVQNGNYTFEEEKKSQW